MTPDHDDLIARLRPKYIADEPIARAVVSGVQAERHQTVTDFLVANNALKSEAVAALRADQTALALLTAERDEAREALNTAEERFDQIDCAGFTQNQQSVSEVLEYVKGLAQDGSKRMRAARKALANEEGGNG